ncbi:helix-turn-helix domain-containing protein [Lactobacillus helveticus]|uniref:Helix-turn-helix domain-containing protein n=1 Tax=Lactobacillus helveticus TaxID=1587 RepID=A0A6A7K0V6_LACHE|nr:helix-turn-helix transcriptional regulator [Lactobacillus helveticus]MPW14179.1 helix-turn-helix domain-containing protein [Lactobacillus helveticus]
MNRIKELRQKNNLTLRGLGQKVDLSKGAISRYENGVRKPKPETWQALADFFNVSVPYLQGIDDKICDLKFPTKKEAIDFIHKIMKIQNIKLKDINDD